MRNKKGVGTETRDGTEIKTECNNRIRIESDTAIEIRDNVSIPQRVIPSFAAVGMTLMPTIIGQSPVITGSMCRTPSPRPWPEIGLRVYSPGWKPKPNNFFTEKKSRNENATRMTIGARSTRNGIMESALFAQNLILGSPRLIGNLPVLGGAARRFCQIKDKQS
ncbi:hypothetical protein EVAR_31940_1 [Eumeta japonica]|uniref:Uncharacterized protein n=1 Tax=Eumeta variegata TaxID=151549 RepID=A0A4C1WTJ2_EUMVA|nr:hypothetical protein EVAR_31940_1 [Eumeta japonica]